MTRFALGLCLLVALLAPGARAADAPLTLHPRHVKVAVAHVVPMPRERPPEIVVAQLPPPTNPDPFNIKRADVPATASPAAPIVVTAPAAPPQPEGFLGYIWAALGTVATALLGKLAFKLPAVPGAPSLDQGKVTDIVKSVVHPNGTSILSDPALRASVDAALLQVVQSGVPGQAIQAGLGLIPGAAPIASTLEPIVRNLVIQALQKHGAPADPNAASAPTAPAADPFQASIAALTAVVQDLVKAHAAKPAGSP